LKPSYYRQTLRNLEAIDTSDADQSSLLDEVTA
jgi:hypothetical protein